jgi:hypothetical protein
VWNELGMSAVRPPRSEASKERGGQREVGLVPKVIHYEIPDIAVRTSFQPCLWAFFIDPGWE